MSSDNLETLVLRLHECLSDSQSSEAESSATIGNIISSCSDNMSPQKIANCLSIFFNREKNLLSFLRKAIGKAQLRRSKCELLDFLHRFICATSKQIIPYVCEIKDTCMSMFDSETYADIRMNTFQIISKILEISVGNMDLINRLDIRKLAETYFKALDRKTSTTGQVKANVLKTLGIMCRYHPTEMNQYSTKCLEIFLLNLKAEMNNKFNTKPELNVIAGALEGLSHYLHVFTQSSTDNEKISKEIFDYSYKALLNSSDDVTRYAMPKAALILLAKHASQFDESIYANYGQLFERIKQWAQHKNYDMKKHAYFTLDSFYNQLAEMLKKKSKNEADNCKRIFAFFIRKFHSDLTNNLDLKETVIAIKGFGAFAGPCREFMEAKDVKFMFEKILEICERTFFINSQQQEQLNQMGQSEIFDEKIYQLPSFIESLSCVCNQINEEISETSINTLERLVILAIDSYPKLIKRYNHQISLAIARLFLSIQLGSQQMFYYEFISKIVYQSLVRIFSYRTSYSVIQEQSNEESNEEAQSRNIHNITSGDYIQLWSNLLNLNEFQELSTIGVHVNEKKKLIQVVYDELVESCLKIMKKLDLNAVKIDYENEQQNQQQQQQQQNDYNPLNSMRASRPKDFEILVNLVDFCKQLLLQKHFNLFEKWIYKFSKDIILLSSNNVLISGFYKLNTLCMRIAIKIGYFNSVNKNKESVEKNESTSDFDDSMLVDDQYQFEKLNCFYLYKKYIREIYVRKKQFKDELLAAVLEFFLSLPKELVVVNLHEVFEALENSLELGINYLPMAENALSSLEYWIKNIDLDKLKPFYGSILNKFDDYLQMNKVANLTDDPMVKEKTIVLKIQFRGSGRKKLPVKLFEKNTKLDNSDIYEQIQLRILTILGQLAGQMSHCLFESNQTSQIIAWDTIQHLKFAMPFVDLKPTIYFDRFLPRIIYLSLSSTNRQTKVNACELLHAIVIYMIGKSVVEPLNSTSAQYQLNKLYNRIYPALFKLACDVDNFARQLFQPLVMQMIHWFTGNRKYESPETIELLNCIMESLVDEKDAALRDFSAIALKEFMKWSIKHTPIDKQNSNNSVNVKSILKRIFSFLNHPNCAKRLGATLAWNSIYTIFREEESLVNKYIFELLYNLVESLALAEQDDKMYGTREQAKLGLDHVERIIRVKQDILNQRCAERVKPPEWSESVLEVAVRWLMRQCGRTQTECRHKSMELVYKLAPLLHGNKEPKDYFQNRIKQEGELYFITRFEGSLDKKDRLKDSIRNFPRLVDLFNDLNQFKISLIKTWLAILVAPLDCYSWIFSQRLLSPKLIFGSGKSCIWTSLNYFIENIANNDLVDLIKLVTDNQMSQSELVCSPNELEEYRQAKCTAIVRLVDFLTTMISFYPSESFSIVPKDLIWTNEFFKCLLFLCLDPKQIGFNLNDLEIYTNLPLKTKQFLKLFTQNAPPDLTLSIKSSYSKLITTHDLKQVISSFSNSTDWIKLSQLITGYEQLAEFNLYYLEIDLTQTIYDHLCKMDLNYEQESVTTLESKRKLFNLCLSLNYLAKQHVHNNSALVADYLVDLIDKYLFQNAFRLFNYFKNEICVWICKRIDEMTKYILSKIKLSFSRGVSLLISLIDYLAIDKQIRKQFGVKVVQALYANWSLFNEYWQQEAQLDYKNLLVDLLTKSILIESINKDNNLSLNAQVSQMYCALLVDPKTNLTFKCKLLDLLCFFSDSTSIKKYLSELVASQFPLRSSELVKGDNLYTDYVNAIRKILTAIELCLSFDLVKEIVTISCREQVHLCDEEIEQCLCKLMKKLDSEKQAQLIGFYWELVFKCTDSNERRLNLFNKCLIHLLSNCDKSTFIDYLSQNIMSLMNFLDADLKEYAYETNALNKKIVFELFCLAYRRLHKDEIFFSNARLCQVYEQAKFGQVKDGKELTKEILRKCRKYLCDEIRFSDSKELDRLNALQIQLHCAAYNCLCSLFIRTQTEPKLYLAFLFKDDTVKNEFIFERLVDHKKQYKFSIEIENLQERKTKFITLRNEFNSSLSDSSSKNYIGSLHSTSTVMNNNNNYVESMQYSSLSEELGVFDFTTHNSINKEISLTLSMMNSSASSLSQTQSTQLGSQKSFQFDQINALNTDIEIEADDLNQHESMQSLVQLIQSLYLNRITPIYEMNQLPTEMPPWMQFLHKKITDLNVNSNVKLFLIRTIINTQNYFKCYAKFWYTPLMGFLVNQFQREEIIDYFTLDLMVVLLSWSSHIAPQLSDKPIINRLFESLVKRSYHSNRSILKNNLELLKTMTELWKDLIEVPCDLLNAYLLDQKKQATAIQLIGLVLTNQIHQFNFNQTQASDFYKNLINLIKDKSKTVHASASEVVGMLLRHLSVINTNIDDLFEYLRCVILSFDEDSMFITCLHRIQLNYPSICEPFLNRLVFKLPSLYGEFKQMCAESIASSITKLEDKLFSTKVFLDMITNRDSILQLICLKMIYSLIDHLSEEELNRLLPIVCSFKTHTNTACRYQMILILINLFERKLNSQKLANLINETLLIVLLDEDQSIRILAQNFWCDNANLPSNTIERLVIILDQMYSPQTEQEYLSYSTNLLLEKTSKSPDYNRFIYENPLSECQFREYNLTADWRRRHEIMTPLFVDSFQSTQQISLAEQSFNDYMLRATQQQSLQFQATQQQTDQFRTPYNWLTQSNVDTLKESLIMSSSLSETQTSTLLFNKTKRAQSVSNQSEDANLARLRRRFLKDTSQETAQRFFARKQLEKKSKEEELKKQLKLKRSNHVEKYRQYRIGDFPDIQIKFAELIAPLQALAQRDSLIAMKLFESMFVSILSEVTYLKDVTDSQMILKQVEANLNQMLNKSDSYNPNFIACLLEISLKHARIFRLDLSSISTACLNSFQQALGICLLEEYLILNENSESLNEPTTKRIKLDSGANSEDDLLWIELAKLYRSINDYDSIKGIFMKKENLASEFTKNGLLHESNNDYVSARKSYLNALESSNETEATNEQIYRVEKELWEQFSLRCCNELTDWKGMCNLATRNKSLEKLYSDSYSLEYIFPYAFKSKLKLILKEDENEQRKHEDLVRFIQGLDMDSKRYLEQTFSQELALFNLHQKDFNAAKYYSYLAIQKYLMEWSSINQTLVQGRLTKLQSLQPIIELNEFLKFIDKNQSYTCEINKDIENLLILWSNTMPNIYSDPPSTWDDVITNRSIYLEYIEDKYFSESTEMLSDTHSILISGDDARDLAHDQFNKKLFRFRVQMDIKFAQAAQFQGNYRLALTKLDQTQSILKSQSLHVNDLKIVWNHCYLRTHLSRAKFANDPLESLNIFFNASALKQITKFDSNDEFIINNELHFNHQLLHSDFTKFLIDTFIACDSKESDFFTQSIVNDTKKDSQLRTYLSLDELKNLEQTVIKLLKHGVDSLSKINEEKSSLDLALYCDYWLRQVENEQYNLEETSESGARFSLKQIDLIKLEYPMLIVKQLLNAIKFNSYEARQRFPRLLQIVELYNEQTLDPFIKSSESVPCWMFLSWLSQMTAILDKPTAKAVYHIIDSIATEYPQAFIYPFKISLESLKFDYNTNEQKEFVEKLKSKMKNQTCINQFINALEQLTSPIMLFQDYMQQIASNIKNRQHIFKLFEELYVYLFDDQCGEGSQVEWGIVKRHFSKFMKERFEGEFGLNGKSITQLQESEIRQKVKKLLDKDVNEYLNKHNVKNSHGNLGDFSPWLKEFKRNLARDIEIPGQYNNKNKPLVEYHIKIESFDERILEMVSIRRPKLLTIRGNDQKEHKFLVKGGEDQRQDQRIEILFELINDLLKLDSRCYQRNLSIKTYQVIPMTTKLALIEWIPDTKTLKEAINSSRDDEEVRRQDACETSPAYKYQLFIESASKDLQSKSITDVYGLVYAKYNKEYVSKTFRDIEQLVPWDLLRRHIRSMSTNTEGYFYLRNQFIISYAVASVCQYILGIGDRHLGNCMIDTKSGRSIPIDFGMAFDHACINLAVPELMPIRLTRQILKLIAPLEQYGLFESTMVHTLRALRDNNDLLMCILDVFIKEPSIDWIGNASKILKQQILDEEMQFKAGVEYAQSRIKSVRNKLIGINPCVITRNDLMSGIHKDGKYAKYFVNALMGDAKDERYKLVQEKGEKYRLNCEEQVKCIIEQSIDPSILGRTYNGWAPYF